MRQRKLRIAAEWESYSREVMPRDASVTQRIETRRAFYSGAMAIQACIMRGLSDSVEATPEEMHMMEDLMAELMAFNERVKDGTA